MAQGLILGMQSLADLQLCYVPEDGAQILLYISGMVAWSPLVGGISASLSPIHLTTVAMGEVARGPISGLQER